MSEIFRDRTEGAMARRQDLLRKRRDELVMMPHTIRRVVVARAARAAASTAAIACGVAMCAVALSPSLAGTIASGLPGINPAVISTMVGAAWILGLVAFAISRGRAEHRFAVAMSTYVLPGDDLDHDIERLSHERPDRVAREMAHRSEVRSAALPVAAAAFVLPATLIYVVRAMQVGGWPSTAEYEQTLGLVARPLLATALAGVVAALVMTRSWARRDGVAIPAALVALLAGGFATAMVLDASITAAWTLASITVISGTIAVINWRLARERTALDIEDPAAGSELFTLRGFLASLRSLAVATARRLPRRPALVGASVAAAALVGGGMYMLYSHQAAQPPAAAAKSVVVTPTAPTPMLTGNSALIGWEMTTDGRIRYQVRFVDGKPLTLRDLNGFQVLPKGWRARVAVTLVDSTLPGAVAVTPFPANEQVSPLHLGTDGAVDHRFTYASCDTESDLGLVLAPDGTWPEGTVEATFLVEPSLEIAMCQ